MQRNPKFRAFSCRIVPWYHERCIQKWWVDFNYWWIDVRPKLGHLPRVRPYLVVKFEWGFLNKGCNPRNDSTILSHLFVPIRMGILHPGNPRPRRLSGSLWHLVCSTNGNAPSANQKGNRGEKSGELAIVAGLCWANPFLFPMVFDTLNRNFGFHFWIHGFWDAWEVGVYIPSTDQNPERNPRFAESETILFGLPTPWIPCI